MKNTIEYKKYYEKNEKKSQLSIIHHRLEELNVEKDPKRYHPRKTSEELEELKRKGFEISEYKGMMPEMSKNSVVIDDISQYETDMLIEKYKPAIFCAGIKEKYIVQKKGVAMKQLHSYDYGGPFAAFKGAVNFYEEIERAVNTKIWQLIKPPWEKKGAEIIASFITD